MEDLSVKEHRLEIEGTKLESHLDLICESVKGHPMLGVGDRLLDWRNNKEDLEKLQSWIYSQVDFMESPCRICGDPIHVCERNPDTNHYFLVVDDNGEIIGESERIVGDGVRGGVNDPENKVVYVPFHKK